MENKEIYLEVKLKEINRDIMKLNVKKRHLCKQLNTFKKIEQKPIKKETKKDQAMIESIYLLKSNPNRLFASKEICQYLKDEINYNTDSFAAIYKRIHHFEPQILQVRRGYYIYKP
ncbi:hypothetical protein SAMN04487776_12224 [Priestia megaterium]|uniref:hypothetical protein n=1 Tax=Priestia megaterium TaxID=1404 RepID=UPI0008F39187|nr:hypothetical protein [Priestia megaterium]MDM8148491.1 hypothetical protein [Priestia megaterium]SFH51152.1 hypothetical protein SAMN04487776_12224 [Priestia megaterium]